MMIVGKEVFRLCVHQVAHVFFDGRGSLGHGCAGQTGCLAVEDIFLEIAYPNGRVF